MPDISDNLPHVLMVLAIISLITEIMVLGFTTFFLFFVGIAFIVTSTLMHFGVIEPSFLIAIYSTAILTLISAFFLWKPLKKIQEKQGEKIIKTDFAEICFVLKKDLTEDSLYTHPYSGIKWEIKSKAPLLKGTRVKVVKKEVGVFWVEPVTDTD
jgi:membrane protein implicated in regulation of membrane protease activity